MGYGPDGLGHLENERLLSSGEMLEAEGTGLDKATSKSSPLGDIYNVIAKLQDTKSIKERDKQWIETLKRLSYQETEYKEGIHISSVRLIEEKGLDFVKEREVQGLCLMKNKPA